MKKVYLSIMALLFAGSALAQTSPVKFGVKAGVNFATMVEDEDGEDEDTDNKSVTSFHLGGYADISISDVFSVQPGISLTGKGSRVEESSEDESYKFTQNVMYVEIPVNAVYKFNNFYIGAGPYAAFAISGKYKEEDTFEGETEKEEEDIKFGSGDDDDLKSTDFGLNIMAGYQLPSGLNFGIGYGFGLSNIASNSGDSNYSIKNKVLSVSVGFSF